MSRYEPLQIFLSRLPGRNWTVEFRELEQILGFSLPPSALRHQAWWANDQHHSHAACWLDAGWRTSAVDLRRNSVTFTKGHQTTTSHEHITETSPWITPSLPGSHPQPIPSQHTTVALISCGKKKADSPTSARDLYLSPRFKYARAIAESRGWRWYVLSALYGLVAPEQVIAPYNQTLMGAPRSERKVWADNVLRQLRIVLGPHSHIVFLAGRDYTEFVAEPLRQAGHIVDEPLAGLRRGPQLSRLRDLASEIRGNNRVEPSGAAAERGTSPVDEIQLDIDRARHIARTLYAAFATGGSGLFGEHSMPEDLLPEGMSQGSREHLNFFTLTICVNYMRNALDLWESARLAWASESTRYLFDPSEVDRIGFDQVKNDLTRAGIALRPTRDTTAWCSISRTLSRKWNADIKKFLADCNFHGPTILSRISRDSGMSGTRDFPLLRGPKIGPLWVRTLRDNALLQLTSLEDVPIPVDVHVMRATLCSGAIRGRYSGSPVRLKRAVRDLWQCATKGLQHGDGRPMIALDVDESLWTLSRLGCSKRGNGALSRCPSGCPFAPACAAGHIRITNLGCDIDIPI